MRLLVAFVVLGIGGVLEAQEQAALTRALSTLSGLTHRTFSSDGTDYWTAANPSYQNPYIVDLWYVFHAYSQNFTVSQMNNIIDKFLAVKNANGIPPTYLLSDATAGSFPPTSGWDPVWFLPMIEQLTYQKGGSISHFSGNAAAYKTMIVYVRANCGAGAQNLIGGCQNHFWGFHDSLSSTGNDLWGSLLFYEACQVLGTLSTAAGNASDASYYSTQAGLISANITALLDGGGSGMFDAASGTNNEIDVLGSAYAVYIGILSQNANLSVSRYLVANYGTLTRSGFVKMTPGDWDSCACNGSGNYQQGYWAVGNEWIAYSMALTNPGRALNLIRDLVSGNLYTIEVLGATQNGQLNYFSSPAGSLAWVNANPQLFPSGMLFTGMSVQGIAVH